MARTDAGARPAKLLDGFTGLPTALALLVAELSAVAQLADVDGITVNLASANSVTNSEVTESEAE